MSELASERSTPRVVVGAAPDGRSTAALRLAALFARSAGEDLVVAAVVPAPWPAGVGRIDAEYQAHLDELARAALDDARASVPADVAATYRAVHARSVAAGLLEVASDTASVLVVGSSPAGPLGRVSLGSVGERLLHACPVPVALAPRGYRPCDGAVVRRVTAAFDGAGSDELVVGAAGIAARVGASLRVASFAVRPAPPRTIAVGPHIEDAVVDEWVGHVEKAQREVLDRVGALPSAPEPGGTVVGRGHDWADALADVEWDEGDVLVVGSSTSGPLERVFLGSRASKIVRNAPVPVVAVPRPVAAGLADDAEHG